MAEATVQPSCCPFKCREKNLDWFTLDVERGLFELHFVLMFRFKFA
jgi:hypothetical protein